MKEEAVQRHRENTAEKEARSKMEWEIRGHIEGVYRAEADARETRRRRETKGTCKKAQNEAKGADPVSNIEENERHTHHEVLGISADANAEQIKKAYHRNALQCHPDKNLQQKEKANRCMKRFVRAYTVLTI